MEWFNKIAPWLKNKYLLTLLGFVAWLLFFDHNDIPAQLERKTELKELEKGKLYYNQQIQEIRKELSALQNDPASLEKAAREKFLMKKDSEEVFVIDDAK